MVGHDYGYRVNMPGDERRAIRERFRMWWSARSSANR